MSRYELIDGPARLAEALADLGEAARLPLDTEFFRERTYFARLCLVQLVAGDRVLIIDPLAVDDLAPLVALLRRVTVTKVLHSARQDIEVLLPLTGEPPGPLFDTQVAASLLGHPAQVGYAGLVGALLGVQLAKGHARTDWARRPLLAAQLAYAADDVRYLAPLAALLHERLAAAGRLTWAEEDSAALLDPSLYRNAPEDAWQRLRGLERMTPQELGVVRALAAWRETRAVRRNLPRAWVLADDTIRTLAQRRPASAAALAAIPGVPPAIARHAGDRLVELIASAPPEHDAVGEPPEQLTPTQRAALRRLQAMLQSTAARLEIVPEVLATRRDLAALARGARDVAPLHGWRREVVGDALLAAV